MSVMMKAICAEEMDITNQHNQFFIYVQICMSCSHHIIDNMPHFL
jgi:hypothetical protein